MNMLGIREPDIYGTTTLDDLNALCHDKASELSMGIDCRQSNHEGEIVTWVQQAAGTFDALIINAAAYTHTSIAIHDALKILEIPVIEVHISDPKGRESFRHMSYIEPIAEKTISGQGVSGYEQALAHLAAIL